jgi:hypothetical protein
MKPLDRIGILFDSSASVNQQSTAFRKVSAIFSQFSMVFHVMDAVNHEEKGK